MKIKIRSKFVTLCSIVLSLFTISIFLFSKQIGLTFNQFYIITFIGIITSFVILHIGEKMRLKENEEINERKKEKEIWVNPGPIEHLNDIGEVTYYLNDEQWIILNWNKHTKELSVLFPYNNEVEMRVLKSNLIMKLQEKINEEIVTLH